MSNSTIVLNIQTLIGGIVVVSDSNSVEKISKVVEEALVKVKARVQEKSAKSGSVIKYKQPTMKNYQRIRELMQQVSDMANRVIAETEKTVPDDIAIATIACEELYDLVNEVDACVLGRRSVVNNCNGDPAIDVEV